MDLLSKLRLVAEYWVRASQLNDHTVSLKTLGVRAVGNSKLFEREGMAVATYEAVALWLGEPSNWPAALVPTEAAQRLCDLGVSVPADRWLPLAA